MDLSKTVVSSERAREFASRAVAAFLRPTERGPAHLRGWALRRLAAPAVPDAWEETEIYDTAGRLLFRDQVLPGPEHEVRARTAANELLAAPVWSVGIGPPLPIAAWLTKAEQAAAKRGLTPIRGKKRLVCYSYPKLGLLCRNQAGQKVVLDLGDRTLVPLTGGTRGLVREALTAWSPWDLVQEHRILRLRDRWAASVVTERGTPDTADGLREAVEAAAGQTEEQALPLTLRGQESAVYCAVAVGQMILLHYGFDKTQREIARAMQTGPEGSTNEAQVAAYSALSNGTLTAVLDQTAEFAEAQREIDAGCPLKSGVSGHARACAGWKTEPRSGGSIERWLQIYDPWPPKKGAIYWENFSAIEHLNYIYVRHS